MAGGSLSVAGGGVGSGAPREQSGTEAPVVEQPPDRVAERAFQRRLKLKSGETLVPLTRDQVRGWADAAGSTVPSYAILDPIDVTKGEARAAAAVFRIPAGADASSAEAQMKIDLGAEGQVSVASQLF